MKKSFLYALAITGLSLSLGAAPEHSPYVITFFVRRLPVHAHQESSRLPFEDMFDGEEKPTTKWLSMLTYPAVPGLLASYSGQLQFSDFMGQVTFSLLHEQDSLDVVITNGIRPIILEGNTVRYLEISEKKDAHLYHYERSRNPNGGYSWDITELPRPKNNLIPAQALIIFAEPASVILSPGVYPTLKTPNLVLPDIMLMPEYNPVYDTITFFKISRFFRPVRFQREFEEDRILQQAW